MVKVEDIQQYGKEQVETAVASATTLQLGMQAIASAYGDYSKKSFEDTKSMVEKLSGVMGEIDPQKAIQSVERLARSRPWAFLGGTIGLGFLGARFMKSSASGAR